MDFVTMFEALLCKYTGFQHAICVDSCTNALMISLEARRLLGTIPSDKTQKLTVPMHTYLSVPMMLLRNGWNFCFVDQKWQESYRLGYSVVDAATHFEKNMSQRYYPSQTICVSFQQKKRLSLDQGGAIFTNEKSLADLCRRLRHDGRDSRRSYVDEVQINPDNIILGWHAYMSPEKAAKGILLLNQEHLLPPYVKRGWSDYPDISHLKCFEGAVNG